MHTTPPLNSRTEQCKLHPVEYITSATYTVYNHIHYTSTAINGLTDSHKKYGIVHASETQIQSPSIRAEFIPPVFGENSSHRCWYVSLRIPEYQSCSLFILHCRGNGIRKKLSYSATGGTAVAASQQNECSFPHFSIPARVPQHLFPFRDIPAEFAVSPHLHL